MTPFWIIPAGALAVGLILFAFGKLASWRFDRKHPNLTRRAMREAERRDRA